jgi:hypothetical protein
VHGVETNRLECIRHILWHMHSLRKDDRFCYADFRLYRYSEAPLRTHKDPHLSQMRWSVARKPSTIKGLACALLTERGIESRKASGRSKAEASLPYREAALQPLKEALQKDREDACTLESASPLQTLPMCIFCRQAAPPGSQSRLIRLGALLRCMGQDGCKDGGSCTCWMSILTCLSRIPAAKSRVVGPL